jgi:5-formyltetrahydrofolate cyclo-ligase
MNKKELRKIYLAKRETLAMQDLDLRSRVITEKFFASFNLENTHTIHIYLPIQTKKEINTWLLIERFRKEYSRIKLIISRSNPSNGTMDNFYFTEETILNVNKWGIPEPLSGDRCASEKVDLVFVPLLAFDKKGNRVGYGKGYYDRFLSECKKDVIKVGLSLEEPVKKIDAELFDVALTHCITPLKVYTFKNK